MSQINNIVKVQISKFLGYKLPPVPEDESIEDIDKYKIYDFDFTKGKLPDGVEFYRLSRDWDWECNQYEPNEPLITDEGLWLWSSRTNLIADSVSLPLNSTGSTTIVRGGGVSETGGWEIFDAGVSLKASETNSAYYYVRSPLDEGKIYTFSLFASVEDGSKPNVRSSRSDPDIDFSVVLEGGILATSRTELEHFKEGVWRVSGVRIATGSSNPHFGAIQRADHSKKEIKLWGLQLEEGDVVTPYIPTNGSQVTVTKSSVFSSTVVRKDFTLFGFLVINGEENEDKYLFSMGREAYPERYIGLKLNRLTNKLQLDSSVGVSKESVKTYKAGDVIKFAVVRCRDRFGVVINGEEFLEINFKVNFLNSDLNKLFFGNLFESDEHILPSYIKHFAIYDKPFNTNTLIHMTEVEDGDS